MTEDIKNNLSKKSLARFIACQAICVYYDANNFDKNLNNILENINEYFVKTDFDNTKYYNIYKSKFVYDLINNVIENQKEYDILINKLLNKQDTTETIDEIILATFRAAIYEFKNSTLDKNIIINEYVDIVGEFYNNVYTGFANGILENLALEIREGKIKEIKKEEPEIKTQNENNNKKSKNKKVFTKIKKKERKIISLKK